MILRGVAAAWTLLSVVWLGFVLRNWIGLGFALIGGLFVLIWAGMVAKARKRAHLRVALRLTPEALHYEDGVSESAIAWGDVRSVEVDEERLVVRIEHAAGEPQLLESMFVGVGIYDLADAVRDAWRASTPAGSPTP